MMYRTSLYIIVTVSQEGLLDHFTVTSDNYVSITKRLTAINPKSFRIISDCGARQDDTDRIKKNAKGVYCWPSQFQDPNEVKCINCGVCHKFERHACRECEHVIVVNNETRCSVNTCKLVCDDFNKI